jgi:mannosyltransferase
VVPTVQAPWDGHGVRGTTRRLAAIRRSLRHGESFRLFGRCAARLATCASVQTTWILWARSICGEKHGIGSHLDLGGSTVHATPLVSSRIRLSSRSRVHSRGASNQAAAVVGLVAMLISLAGSWVPSYWSDEVATLRVTRLSWQELFAFVEHKDAVHAAYYSVTKLWVGAFGESELATRSLSAIAIGAAAAGLVILATAMTNARVAVIAGVIFAVLPRTTSMGIEARSFALSAAFAVWTTVVLLAAVRSNDGRWWAGYAALGAAGTYVFLYSPLLLVAHLGFLLIHHRARRILVPWLIATAVSVVTALPILFVSVAQKEQIAWLSDQPVVNPWTILVEPGFDSSWLVAAVAWCSVLLLPLRCRAIVSGPQRRLAWLAAAWVFVPLVLLLSADAVVGPLYTARYLSLSVPAIAILLAITFSMSSRSFVAWLLVAVLALAGAPTYISQRGPFAKNGGSDLSQIADYVDSNVADGDGVYLQDTGSVTLRPRQALYAYPTAFVGADDVAFEASFTTTGTFSDRTHSLEEIVPTLAVDRLWVVTAGPAGSGAAREAQTALQQVGFFDTKKYETNRSLITLYEH